MDINHISMQSLRYSIYFGVMKPQKNDAGHDRNNLQARNIYGGATTAHRIEAGGGTYPTRIARSSFTMLNVASLPCQLSFAKQLGGQQSMLFLELFGYKLETRPNS